MRVVIVGAGLSGAVSARCLAEAGHIVSVLEARDHVAGNCHTRRCSETGVLVHVYGPHVFHTADSEVWSYVNRFARFRPYRHSVRAVYRNRVYSLPINLLTINSFFGTCFGPDEARRFVAEHQADTSIRNPRNFEEAALRYVGRDLYKAFLEGYTKKQWGLMPDQIPATVFKRLPLRFTYDDNYFAHPYQGLPEHGYTKMVEAILDHPGIDVHLNRPFDPSMSPRGDHLVWTGPLDGYYGERLGRLGYRTLDFEQLIHDGDFQGCAVMNYSDPEVPFTRITEHKYFSPWEQHEKSVCYREYSRACAPGDIPYYPIRLANEKSLLAEYELLARAETDVSFLGRLGTYRYLDMDVTIREALDFSHRFLAKRGAADRSKPSRAASIFAAE